MEFGEAQKNSPEALKTVEHDLKIKNLDIHKTLYCLMENIVFSSSEGYLGAQICIEKALGIRF